MTGFTPINQRETPKPNVIIIEESDDDVILLQSGETRVSAIKIEDNAEGATDASRDDIRVKAEFERKGWLIQKLNGKMKLRVGCICIDGRSFPLVMVWGAWYGKQGKQTWRMNIHLTQGSERTTELPAGLQNGKQVDFDQIKLEPCFLTEEYATEQDIVAAAMTHPSLGFEK
ncbi:MAG: hypothetical protein Q9187_000871 [Circinaria calcarea]